MTQPGNGNNAQWENYPPNNSQEAHPTGEFRPVNSQQQPEQWFGPQQQPASSGGSTRVAGSQTPWWAVALITLLAVLIAALAFFLFRDLGDNSSQSNGGAAPANGGASQAAGPATVTQQTTVQQAPTPAPAPAPAASVPSNANYVGSGVYVAGPTTGDFAHNVASAYRSYGSGNHTVRAYSPAKERYYPMSCVDYGGYAHCAGGDNANVYITH